MAKKKFDKKQLAMGMKVELEHKDITHGNKVMTKKIAEAHLKEVPDYYTRLKKMETAAMKPEGKKMKKMSKAKSKVKKVMHEWKEGELHSGSKKGPKVGNRKQAIAIAMSEAGISKKKKKRK